MDLARKNKNFLDWTRTAKFLVGAFIFFIFLQNSWRALDPDMGWHIRTGQLILENRIIPRYDQLSFTMPGHPWVDHEWLVDVFLAATYQSSLWFLVVVASSLLFFVPLFYWLTKATSVMHLTPVLLAGVILSQFVAVRPQLISFVFFFVVFSLVFKLYAKKKSLFSGKYKFIFPVIFFIWANLHAGFFSGILLFFIYISVRTVYSKIIKIPYPDWKEDLACFVLSALATLINPYGLKIYQEIFSASLNNFAATYIQEWKPIFTFIGSHLLAFNLFLAIFLVPLFYLRKKIDPVQTVVAIFFLLAGMKSARLIQFFLIAALPIIFSGIDIFLLRIRDVDQPRKEIKKFVESFPLIVFLVFFSWGIETDLSNLAYSSKAVNFLKKYIKRNGEVRIFNDYAWGGYLDLELPESKVFIDGRMPHWRSGGNSAMEDYVKAFFKGEWREVFEKREINLAFLRKLTPQKPNYLGRLFGSFLLPLRAGPLQTEELYESLGKNGWEIIYEDNVSIILKKPHSGRL